MFKPIKLLAIVVVTLASGMSGMVLAESGHSGTGVIPSKQDNFSDSQFKLDMILARRGDPDAQYYVGNAYELGRGTQKNMQQAITWYSKAAQQNQYDAEYRLGYLYEHGVGVKRDIAQAMEWYKRAAGNSQNQVRNQMNQQVFAHRKEQMKRSLAVMEVENKKREQERRLAEERARQKALRRQQLLAAARAKVVAPTVHKQVAAARVSIHDIIDVILKNKWRDGSGAADYLPSSTTHCLRSSGSEVICFSDQKLRVINGQRVTYTTKATLTGFKPDGTFHVSYNYNAVQLAKASSRGLSADPNGLKLQTGWQEPRLAVNCRTTDRVNLYCSRGNIRLHYRH